MYVFVGAVASLPLKFRRSKLSRNEKPFWIPSQNTDYPRIFRVTGANQNARKLHSTDLVNTNMRYWPSVRSTWLDIGQVIYTYQETNVRMLTSVRHFACAGENKGTESKTERESLGVGRDMWLSPKLFWEVVIKRKSHSWDARTF